MKSHKYFRPSKNGKTSVNSNGRDAFSDAKEEELHVVHINICEHNLKLKQGVNVIYKYTYAYIKNKSNNICLFDVWHFDLNLKNLSQLNSLNSNKDIQRVFGFVIVHKPQVILYLDTTEGILLNLRVPSNFNELKHGDRIMLGDYIGNVNINWSNDSKTIQQMNPIHQNQEFPGTSNSMNYNISVTKSFTNIPDDNFYEALTQKISFENNEQSCVIPEEDKTLKAVSSDLYDISTQIINGSNDNSSTKILKRTELFHIYDELTQKVNTEEIQHNEKQHLNPYDVPTQIMDEEGIWKENICDKSLTINISNLFKDNCQNDQLEKHSDKKKSSIPFDTPARIINDGNEENKMNNYFENTQEIENVLDTQNPHKKKTSNYFENTQEIENVLNTQNPPQKKTSNYFENTQDIENILDTQNSHNNKRSNYFENTQDIENVLDTQNSHKKKRSTSPIPDNKLFRNCKKPKVSTKNPSSITEKKTDEGCSNPYKTRPSRLSVNQQPKIYNIICSGFNYEKMLKYEKIIQELGGCVVENNGNFLVSTKFFKSIKTIISVSRGVPLVSCRWITDSRDCAKFLDHTKYIFKDKSYVFCNPPRKFLEEYTLYVVPSDKFPSNKMKEVIENCGGRCIIIQNFEETFNIIADNKTFSVIPIDDKNKFKNLPKPHIKINTFCDFVLSQELNFSLMEEQTKI